MTRKTIDVKVVLEQANKTLASKEVSPEFRAGVAMLLEHILMKADAYAGFNYLDWLEGGFEQWYKDKEALGVEPSPEKYLGDQSRRRYYMNYPNRTNSK